MLYLSPTIGTPLCCVGRCHLALWVRRSRSAIGRSIVAGGPARGRALGLVSICATLTDQHSSHASV